MSTLSDMAEIDKIAHWCYILTLPWPRDIPRSWQGHLKVTARSNQLKKSLKIYFCCFSTITFILDDKVISRSQQGQIIYKQLVIIACFCCFCCFCYNYVHFRLRKYLGLSLLWSPTPTHVTMCWCQWGITPPALLLLSCNLLRCFVINQCQGLGMVQAIIDT